MRFSDRADIRKCRHTIYYTLIHAGVRPENIHFSGICTWENADILWSHRRSGGKRGNMNAFLKIKD